MRVLIVSQYFWPENFRVNDLSVELVKRGHVVTVLTGLPNYPDGEIFEDFRKAPANFANLQGVEIVRVPLLPRKKGSLRLMLNYLSFVVTAAVVGGWKLRGRAFDVVLTNQLSPVTVGLPAAWLAMLKRAPMAMWVLDLWPDTLLALGTVRSPRILNMVGKLVSFIYRRCDLILAQSRSFVPQIRKLAGPKQRIEYFPSWAEDVFQPGTTVTPAPEVPPRAGTFNVMFAGNIGECQDFPCILDAAEHLRDHEHIRWLIVGDGRVAPWVREELQRRGLDERVELLGRHPLERMPSFFAHADALLVTLADQPIFAMTIPGKLQSYFAAGKPVVAALNGEGAELIERTGAGKAAPAGNPQALADAVLELSRLTPQQRDAMGAAGLATSRSEFDRDTIISRMESWLSGLAARSTDATRAHNA
jgi:colanic acid biosynthesis glycosyl transferase WcaI